MKYLLDTNTCIYILNRAPDSVQKKFQRHKIGDIGMSAITLCELQYGVENSAKADQNQNALNELLGPIEVLDFPGGAGVIFGKIKQRLKKKGIQIGAYDSLIAAHCLHEGLVLVTNNVKEFGRIPELRIENWIE